MDIYSYMIINFKLSPALRSHVLSVDTNRPPWGLCKAHVGHANIGQMKYGSELGNNAPRTPFKLLWWVMDITNKYINTTIPHRDQLASLSYYTQNAKIYNPIQLEFEFNRPVCI